VRVCFQEVGYHTEKVVKCLQKPYHQVCQASFINNGGLKIQKDRKDRTHMFSCNPDRRRFHVLDRICRSVVAVLIFPNIMSRGADIMLACLVSLLDFSINSRSFVRNSTYMSSSYSLEFWFGKFVLVTSIQKLFIIHADALSSLLFAIMGSPSNMGRGL
jgi:hypothetical protein